MGFFQDERDRRRALMRQRFPSIAGFVDALRAAGCTPLVVQASEGGHHVGDASAFVGAWNDADSLRIAAAFASVPRGTI